MNKEVKKDEKKELQRIEDAKANFEKMQKEIAPFVRNRKYKRYVAEEQWRETASLCKQNGLIP
jgi:hypothetical protein